MTQDKLFNSEFGVAYLNRAVFPEFCGGTFPDAKLPPVFTGELIINDPEAEKTHLKVSARECIETKIPVPAANSTLRLMAVIDAYGINTEVNVFRFYSSTSNALHFMFPSIFSFHIMNGCWLRRYKCTTVSLMKVKLRMQMQRLKRTLVHCTN